MMQVFVEKISDCSCTHFFLKFVKLTNLSVIKATFLIVLRSIENTPEAANTVPLNRYTC